MRVNLFLLLFLTTCWMSPLFAASCQDNSVFNIGAGIYDITGPAAEEGMMGYGMLKQQTAGLYQRLWARAFVIESPCNGKRIVFVNADLGQIFQGVKQQVIKKLQEKYGDRYSDKNVLLTATHTHSGPGGFSTYTFYNITTLGFSQKNFDTIVNGIVEAIARAQNNMQAAQIKVARMQLNGISYNRSPQSYLQNPENERRQYQNNIDTEMTLLRFDTLEGKPIGLINWFPIHGVSMNNKNHLITGDNKGYAEYLFEKDFASDYGPHAFVAAFAQANAGDVSPNPYGHEGGAGILGVEAVERAGKPQYLAAKDLFERANEVVKGGIDYRHEFVAMDKVLVTAEYTKQGWQLTCPAAIGVSMLAGTQDGEGVGVQGVTCKDVKKFLPLLVCENVTTSCQGVKPIAVSTGTKKPHPWTPNILPIQLLKIGNVFIAGAPFELTTMTGRRIKASIDHALASWPNHYVMLSALSNAYAGYIATNDEYQIQRYEGASTHFGPWTQAALTQELTYLTKALVDDKEVKDGPTPPDLLGSQINLQPGVIFDDKPLNKKFGDVYANVKSTYKRGETVEVTFWGAHPKNNYHTQSTFLEIQHLENGKWKTVLRDRDWGTEYHWRRHGAADSLVTIAWRTSPQTMPGVYRIVHFGDWKSFWTKKINAYTGYSAPFTLQ